ncbi:hypothetical protein [Streptomyces flavofungini]|uniref:Uncharacterized protein n=1 Tax=Streptomyces flavofungini TaxID=68200 RepID=A0ABS0X9F4_9ACTN|nr:hypothetical protein [Streptomyces flavofungini]MBJ3809626.1 hypothetical protein [Streptomyces flavofungini]GHC55850.1 hypothetical protein GCM10010349_22950 [Streptomyces flavofungini]
MTTPESPIFDRTATRRLCAGVYLDTEFRDAVLHRVYNARKRRVAPSYGYDLVPVVTHAWRAWWLSTIGDAVLLTLCCAAILLYPLPALLAAVVLFDVGLVLAALTYGVRSLRAVRDRSTGGAEADAPEASWHRDIGYGVVIAALLTVGVFAAVRDSVRDDGGITAAAVIALTLPAVLAVLGTLRQLAVNRLRAHGTDPRRPRARGRLAVIESQQRHPMVVYSGDRPFVGSGSRLRTWSFAQRLVEAKPLGVDKDVEFEKKPFATRELVEELRRAITTLGSEEDPETRLPGLRVLDSLFVEGRYARGYADDLEPDAGAALVERVLDRPQETVRHYLTCQVESWGGEVVTTVFVHVSLQGRTMYIEFSSRALAPTRLAYQVVDTIGGTGTLATLRAAAYHGIRIRDIALAPVRLLRAPLPLLGALGGGGDATVAQLKRGRDIGADCSARELAAIGADENYFQTFDVVKHLKIIEQRLLSTVGDYLTERGVDTSEFRRRATAILNNGVISTGNSGIIQTGSGDIDMSGAMGEGTSVGK